MGDVIELPRRLGMTCECGWLIPVVSIVVNVRDHVPAGSVYNGVAFNCPNCGQTFYQPVDNRECAKVFG